MFTLALDIPSEGGVCVLINLSLDVTLRIPIKGVALCSLSLFTHPSQCCFSFLSTTWLIPLAPAQSHLSTVAHSSETHVPTSPTVGLSGILFGAVLSRISRVHGLRFIPTSRVLRRGKRTILFKDGYGTHFCHLQSIAFLYSFVLCWYPSMF